MKRFFLPFFLLIVAITSDAQQAAKWPKTLLWKISGNNLVKPSFLYGTMHLQDKRLFHFGDSLYHYLEQVDGYALEIDLQEFMDSIIQRAIDQSRDEFIEKRKLKPAEEKSLIDSLISNVKKHNDKASKKKLEKMRQEKINTVTKKEMPTIMDAYLFGIAKRHGKWVGGIEDVQDQLAIYDEIGREVSRDELLTTDDKLKAMIDEMVSIYLDQDLDKIENYFSHKSTEELQELLFIRRNIKMSRRIDSLSTIRTMFFAVGVAHLPGDSGVINLLKNKGYKVEPIFSTEKIDPEKYTSGLGKQPWVKTEDEKKTYTIEMPGKASDMDIFGELFKIKMYVDITTLTYFMSGSTITQNKVDPATMLEKFAMNITSGKVESKKMIEREGAKGIEGIIKAEGNYYKVQYLLKNNLVFMVMAGGQNRNLLESEDVKRYFQSFAINKDIQPKPDKEWSVFSLSEKAFSVMLPGLPKQNKTIEKKADGTTWSFTVYDYNDLSSGKYYMVQVRDLLPGYYLTGDSTYFSLFKENFVNSVKKVLREESIKIQTFPALRFDGISDEEQFSLATLNINRGNRIYSLMVVTTGKTTQDKQIEQFFNSFIITDYKASAWKKEWSPDMSFYTVVPYPITLKEKEETDSMNMEKSFYYLSFNPHEVVSYQVFKEPIPEYFWTGNDSLLFDHFGRAYKAYQDSILKKKSVMNGQLKGMEWVIQMPDNNNLKKVRQILNGDTLYTLISLIPSQYIERRDHQQFFDEFRLANESILSSVYQSKARKLLEALLSKDSATFTKASEAVSSAPFSREDLPLLHTAITRLYADDTSWYYNTRSKIVNQICKLADSSTIEFIRSHFDSLSGEKAYLQFDLLHVLARYQTDYSYSLLKELLLKHTPRQKKDDGLSHYITDSLELAKKMFPEILELSSNDLFAELIISISRDLLDSNFINLEMFKAYHANFLHTSDTILSSLKKKSKIEDGYRYLDLVHLLAKFNDDKSNNMLQQFVLVNDMTIKQEAVLTLLSNNQSVDSREIEKLAVDRAFRKDVYEELKKMGKERFFPVKYKTQRHMAESELYYYAADDYEPSDMSFIGEKTIVYKNKKQKFYLFKVLFNEDSEEGDISQYLGIAGPYSTDPNNYNSDHDATGLLWDEEFDNKKIDKLFKKYIAGLEENHGN